MNHLFAKAIGFYRKHLSFYLGNRCRFVPTCSHYAQEAIEQKGVWAGSLKALGRLLKCHPLHPGGYDPVESDTANG
ncbi:MAG: membrane protein insertion efficiency factor YidD [Candidatus Omnitrophota bacterium]